MGISASKLHVWNRALDRIGETESLQAEDERVPAALVCEHHYDDIVKEVFEARMWRWPRRHAAITDIAEQTETTAGTGSQTVFAITFSVQDTLNLTVELLDSAGVYTELAAVTGYTFTPSGSGFSATVTPVAGAPTANESIRVTLDDGRVGWKHIYSVPADMVTPVALLPEDTRFDTLAFRERLEYEVYPNGAGDAFVLCCNVPATDFEALEYIALIDNVRIWPRTFLECIIWRLAVELALALPKDIKLARDNMGQYYLSLEIAAARDFNIGQSSAEPTTPSIAARN